MDIIADYQKMLKRSNDKIFKLFQRIFPKFNLYSMSIDWRKTQEYILKFKGGNGDIIVRWK